MLTSILIGVLVDKKMLDYDQKISDIWPEYAKNGKEEGTLADLMRHELGLPFLSETPYMQDCTLENIKNNKIGAMIESESYHFNPGEKGRFQPSGFMKHLFPFFKILSENQETESNCGNE